MCMKRWLFGLIIGLPIITIAQNFDFEKQSKGFSDGLGVEDVSIQVNSSVGTAFKNSYFLNNSFIPSLTFDVSKRFSTQVGIGTSISNYNNFPLLNNEWEYESQSFNRVSFFAYVSGNYEIKQNLNIYSLIMVEDVNYSFESNSPVINRQYKDVTVGINYAITPKVSINAEINVSDRPLNSFNYFGNQSFGLHNNFAYPTSW